jgi:O-antigen ligase
LLIIVVQAGVAVAQFWLQRDLGWAILGEYTIDAQVTGTSVLWSNEEVWVRGYGLTAHPNVLGGMLAVLLLVLLPQLRERRGWQKTLLAVGMTVGLLGLLVSFSRTGWLAFLGGLTYWVVAGGERKTLWTQRVFWLPFLIVPIFLFFYHDLILSRLTNLDTVIEARSIQERVRDAQVAMTLIDAHLWQGVGAGNGLAAAQAVRPDAGTVHNVVLLVMTEVGIVGGVCWLLFMLAPFLPVSGFGLARRPPDTFPAYRPAWIGLLIAGLFDTSLWLTTSWRAALLLGLLAALQLQGIDDRNENA